MNLTDIFESLVGDEETLKNLSLIYDILDKQEKEDVKISLLIVEIKKLIVEIDKLTNKIKKLENDKKLSSKIDRSVKFRDSDFSKRDESKRTFTRAV